MTRRTLLCSLAAVAMAAAPASAREAKLVRSPSYHGGKVAFSYLGDIWTASEDGKNIQRLTVHRARDTNPRFSPDGKWIAFSSDREGNLDVFVIPAEGGAVKQVTTHSADDSVQGWSPDGKSILFVSSRGEGFGSKLYVVPATGGEPRDAGPDMGIAGSFSPDGKKLAINRKGQSYWRKYYRGAYQTDVTVMDIAAKSFKDLTDFDGLDSWPQWAADGHIYFVSDREGNGLTNVFRVAESGGKAEQVTDFKAGDVRFPSISADGKTLVFEHDFGIWKLDLAGKKATPIKLDIAAETQESLTEFRDLNSQADEFDVAPNGRKAVVGIRGELFLIPTDEGDVKPLSLGASRDQEPRYSPDGKFITFLSDRDGSEELYIIGSDGNGDPKKITQIDALKTSYTWSPDSKKIAIASSDGKLRVYDVEAKSTKEIASAKYGNMGRPSWSPDGTWLVYSKADVTRTSDVYLLPTAGGEEKKVTFDSANDMNPRFSFDGTKIIFTRVDMSGGGGGGGRMGGGSQLYVINLVKEERDPDDPETRPETPTLMGGFGPGGNTRNAAAGAGGPGRATSSKPVSIDWAGLKRRTRRLTRTSGSVFNFITAPGNLVVFVAMEGGAGGPGGGGFGGAPSIYSISDDGKRTSRLASGNAPEAPSGEETPTPFGRGFGGGGISNLVATRDGRTLYFKEGNGIYSTSLGGGGGLAGLLGAGGPPSGGDGGGPGGGRGGRGGMFAAAAASSATPASSGSKRKLSFPIQVRIDKPSEWAEMFDDAWRSMKYRFYDAKMHGKDWDAARARYKPLVEFVGDRQELMNVINEMIGELNASHTGASAGRDRDGGSPGISTVHLGFDLVPDDAAGLYKVDYIYEEGPCDKDWVKIARGNYLIALDGQPVKLGDDLAARLNRRLNRRVEVTLGDKPKAEGAWKFRIEPIPGSAYSTLRYERWVKERREMTDKLSDGRVGYVHIKAMDQPSLRRFEKELREFRHKDALVIDQRFNGGGNIEQELLALLVQKQYQVWHPRGTEPTTRPMAGFFGPKVVLQNWRSASNAEMFPAGFRALGLGKVVGTPTMGAVIGTNSYSLIDGSTIRSPEVGVYLNDQGRTNMENTGVKPDIYVENTPEDNLANRDRQLETAVKEVLKELSNGTTAAGGAR